MRLKFVVVCLTLWCLSTLALATAPSITSFTPISGPIGTVVTVSGSYLASAPTLTVNGVSETVNLNVTAVTLTIASGTTTGPIKLTTAGGTATNATSFTVIPTPAITSFSPTSGAVGQSVVVSGSGFTGTTAVKFNGVAATNFIVVSATSIATVVPSGASTGKISVTTAGGTASSATNFTVTSVATPPTITAIGSQLINLNTASSALAFTVGDAVTPAGSLTVTGVSSNSTLFPASRIVFGGSGAARTVTVTPGTGQSGTATITLTVTDGGGLTATTSFPVTVNAPPTITPIANQLINMGTSTSSLAFTVGDDLTAAGALTVTAVSSNTSLIHAGGIVLTGPSAADLCAVKVTPISTYSGLTTITLTVTDGGGLTAKTSFGLTVNRPTISAIANQTVAVSTPTTALDFIVGDSITPVASITVTGASNNYALVPNASIVFGGNGAARTVMVTPVSGKSGTATITLTVKDAAALTATTSFTVTVSSALPGTPGTNATDGASMVWVPGASFTMGSLLAQDNGFASGGETQQVTLSGYWIYKYQVTVAQYRVFCAATSHALPLYPSAANESGQSYTPWSQNVDWTGTAGNLQQTPIVNVDWYDAQAYAT